jgi:predicted GNAT superfamily acetyltransferase
MEDKILYLKNKITKEGKIQIRKASEEDVDGIFKIASSVGGEKKNPREGFLMDDYTKDIKKHKRKILNNIIDLDYFYVAEYEELLGYLIAYSRDQWLNLEENWLDEVYWHTEFDKSKLDDFILIDKTAIYSGLTGLGIGSSIYKTLFKELMLKGIYNIFAETLIAPMPNFASLEFRLKQNYSLCGFRYEKHFEKTLSTLVYYKELHNK